MAVRALRVGTLVRDSLNTHAKGASCKVFESTWVCEVVQRIDFRFTPKCGSWLNIAEIELRWQCMHGRRIGESEKLR